MLAVPVADELTVLPARLGPAGLPVAVFAAGGGLLVGGGLLAGGLGAPGITTAAAAALYFSSVLLGSVMF